MSIFHNRKSGEQQASSSMILLQCYCMDKTSHVDSKNSLFLVKVGNLYISDAIFEPDVGECSWVRTTDTIREAVSFDSLEQAAIVADYCGGKVILMEPREIAVHRNRQEPGD